ncbi:transposable element Tcb2 transposase [Trichonephila clavipes]|nr:transposable element Tcb2 transposase [Trichonephila clavipes]
MSSRHHIDDFMRGRIIGKIEEGRKITDVGREFDIAHSVVSRLWKSFKTTGMCSRRHGEGRVRSTTPAEDRYIVLSAKRNRRTTAQQHLTTRLQWCREHHNWTEQDWACVLFSDESRFSLSSDCRRQLIWRESGTAYRPENIQEKDRYPTCSIMVWAGIMINGRTRLHVGANGTMTGQRYIYEVLLPHVRLFRGAVGDKFVFMEDNATCHRTLAVQDCLDSEGIQLLVWPARSLDLNPIENVWDALGRQVAGRNYRPTNKNTLIRALTEEWDKLPQQLLDNVVQSFVFGALCVGVTFLVASLGHLVKMSIVIGGLVNAPNLAVFLLAACTTKANEQGVILGMLVSLALSAYLSFIPKNKPYPFLPLSNECPSSESAQFNSTTFANLSYSPANIYTNTTFLPSSRPETEDESFHLSYMWISTLALITCLTVGYFGSWIISCLRGKSNKVPGIYLSPIRTRLFKQFNTDEKKGKYRTIKVEVNERSNETGINVTNKAQVETHL